ncbi:MAG: hydroxymethylbilane synthase [Candidatus Zixiibacteriota bacterium]|nr:MAG: hydroxymethylbilane synthase [candidate division Zixibacteria bacterium]
MKSLVIGSRGSELALWQANFIKSNLANHTDVPIEIRIIKTQGDKIDHLSFSEMEGKGFFTKELEEALLGGTIDLAVHSLKDLQTTMPDGLDLGAVCFREDPRELVLIRPESYDSEAPLGIKEGGTVGTSSVRRQCQIAHLAPNLKIKDLRGNVPTRIRKLREGQYDAIILANAGVKRLDLDVSDIKSLLLGTSYFLPAPAQGILGIQIRRDDQQVASIVAALDDADLRNQVALERGLLARFDGGCQLPLAVTSEIVYNGYLLRAALGVHQETGWRVLRRVDLTGADIKTLLDGAYQCLNTPVDPATEPHDQP